MTKLEKIIVAAERLASDRAGGQDYQGEAGITLLAADLQLITDSLGYMVDACRCTAYNFSPSIGTLHFAGSNDGYQVYRDTGLLCGRALLEEAGDG